MLQMKVRVNRSFFYILSGLVLWIAAGAVPVFLVFDRVFYGVASALLAATAAVLSVARHRSPSTDVVLLTSVALLIGALVLTLPPLALGVGLAGHWPFQYLALILLYVVGIFLFVAAAAIQLRRGVIQRRREQGNP